MKKYLMIMMAGLFLALPVKAADFQKGYEAYERGDYEIALAEFIPLAEAGNADAQFRLGGMYYAGFGVSQDYAEAAKWVRLAAEQGHATAQFNLGMMYYHGQGVTEDDAEAVKWYRLAAEQGYSKAQFHLGMMYGAGIGVLQDDAEADKWYRRSRE